MVVVTKIAFVKSDKTNIVDVLYKREKQANNNNKKKIIVFNSN